MRHRLLRRHRDRGCPKTPADRLGDHPGRAAPEGADGPELGELMRASLVRLTDLTASRPRTTSARHG